MEHHFAARSLLFTPGTRADCFARAGSAGADIVALDLEDSVAPADKEKARRQALSWLSEPKLGAALRALRINSLHTPQGTADLRALTQTQARPDLIIVPKAASAAEIRQLDAHLQGPLVDIRFVALIESAKGLIQVEAIAECSPRLVALMLGAADLSADLRSADSGDALLYARSRVVCAAAAAGIDVLDSPCLDLANQRTLADEVAAARRLGFTGKAAIHPKQIAPIHAAFTPTQNEIEEAKRIVAENERGVGVVDGKMIDEAVARRARRILALASTP